MFIKVNGQTKEFSLQIPNIESLLADLQVAHNRGVAVALNDQVVPKSEWSSTTLNDNDRVEIISPFQGG